MQFHTLLQEQLLIYHKSYLAKYSIALWFSAYQALVETIVQYYCNTSNQN